MSRLSTEEIIEYLKAEIEPLNNPYDGTVYRAAVYLTDGHYLPCVSFQSATAKVARAKKVFSPKKLAKALVSSSSEYEYEMNAKLFITAGNMIALNFTIKSDIGMVNYLNYIVGNITLRHFKKVSKP